MQKKPRGGDITWKCKDMLANWKAGKKWKWLNNCNSNHAVWGRGGNMCGQTIVMSQFEGCFLRGLHLKADYFTFCRNKSVPTWEFPQMWWINSAFISRVWRLHQMDSLRPSISQNALRPGFFSRREDGVTMGRTGCHRQPTRREMRWGQPMTQPDIFCRLESLV